MASFVHKSGAFPLGEKTYIMGILNVTPDSFFDGGLYNAPEKSLSHTLQMINDGADIIDIGANSTRPGANILSSKDELNIIKEYLPFLAENAKTVFSVDTFYPEVAEYALENGVSVINDVSGEFNEDMANVVKKYNCGWVIMYKGSLYDESRKNYPTVIESASAFFTDVLNKCEKFGIPPENIMLDPGIGFGQCLSDDISLIKNINLIKNEKCALLMALSNKRVIKSTSRAVGNDRIYGTIAANTLSVLGGVDFVRVHNVRENRLAMNTADWIVRGKNG